MLLICLQTNIKTSDINGVLFNLFQRIKSFGMKIVVPLLSRVLTKQKEFRVHVVLSKSGLILIKVSTYKIILLSLTSTQQQVKQ